MYREFHLFDFPENTYLIFEKDFLQELFDSSGLSVAALATLLDTKKAKIYNWRRAERNVSGEKRVAGIPVKAVKALAQTSNFPQEMIEKKVFAYHCENGLNSIEQPSLPVVEDERLVRILVHIIADGHDGGLHATPFYYNINKDLRDQFISDLSVFGHVPIAVTDNGFRIRFPKTISYLLRRFYAVSFGCRTARIPTVIKTLPSELIVEVVRAFMDDEGSVGHSYVRAISVNSGLLADIRELILLIAERQHEEIRHYVTEIKARDRGRFTFWLNKPALDWYNKNIGFAHEEKKAELGYITARVLNKRRGDGYTRTCLLDLLGVQPKTINMLEKETGLTRGSVSPQLHKLLEQNRIQFFRQGKSLLWEKNESFNR